MDGATEVKYVKIIFCRCLQQKLLNCKIGLKVEKLLSGGPNGLYLVKNSTEFAGDLTLCLQFEGSVLYYRVRSHQGGRFTVDNDQTFSSVSHILDNLVL